MAYNLQYSDYPTTQGPPDPARWVGPPGPPGPQGPTGPTGPQGPAFPEAPADGTIYGRGGATPDWSGVLPLAGGTVSGQTSYTYTGAPALTIGSNPFGGRTLVQFNSTITGSNSSALFINKVGGSVHGDPPQIHSYFQIDHDGSENQFHTKVETSVTGNSGIWALMNASAFSSNDSVYGAHVGFYSQQVRTPTINPGGARGIPAWCSVMELRSQTGLPSSQDGTLQTLELDIFASGADDYLPGRTVLSIVIGQDTTSHPAVEVNNGISFYLFGGHTGWYKNMLYAAAQFNTAVLNTTQATQHTGANAIWLGDGHTIALDTAGTHTIRWDGSQIHLVSPVQIDGLAFLAGGTTVGGTAYFAGSTYGPGLDAYLAAPPAIGGTTPAAANFTTVDMTGLATFHAGITMITGAPLSIDNGPWMQLVSGAGGAAVFQWLGTRVWGVDPSGNMTASGSLGTGGPTGPTWTTGSGVPSSTQPVGSLYSRVSTWAAGATLYVSKGAGAWTAVAGV